MTFVPSDLPRGASVEGKCRCVCGLVADIVWFGPGHMGRRVGVYVWGRHDQPGFSPGATRWGWDAEIRCDRSWEKVLAVDIASAGLPSLELRRLADSLGKLAG